MTNSLPLLRWTVGAETPPLKAGQLHLWRIDADADWPQLDSAAAALLCADERERGARLRDPRLRRRFLLTHLATRRILGGYLRREPAAIAFSRGPNGKPRVQEPATGLEFNLSTTGALSLLAVRLDEPLGIDCERLNARCDPIAIARRMLGDEEARRIEQLDGDEQLLAFYIAWTALEARVKRDGRGLAGYKDQDAPDVRVVHTQPAPKAVCALAGRALPPPDEWITRDWPEDTQ